MQTKLRDDDTIAAIATPPGTGAIAVIRISGPGAIAMTASVFRGRTGITGEKGYTVHHGSIHDENGRMVDEVLVTLFRNPHSYTGEDSVEISCHGGTLSAGRVLDLLRKAGTRQAEPGEFTRRAFLNGKMDLSQAEAVADLIASRSIAAHTMSLSHLAGRLGEQIRKIREDLLDTCSLLEIDLDFSEEGISVISVKEISEKLVDCRNRVTSLLSTYNTGKVLRDGVRVTLIGPPNSGKSSLFNALMAEERAIVSETPGTTRDYIEESIEISGVLFSFVDTAGARETTDHIEAEGTRRARLLGRMSDFVIAVVDIASPGDADMWRSLLQTFEASRVLVAFNKIDLVGGEPEPPPSFPHEARHFPMAFVSARTGNGLDQLRSRLLEMAVGDSTVDETGLKVTNQRHAEALKRAETSMTEAIKSHESGVTSEFVALDLRCAVSAIGEITGEITTDDLLERVFGRFCIGK